MAFGAIGFHTSSLPQSFPAQPVRHVVAQAPGGTADRVAREIGQQLSEKCGHTVIIDNKAGAGGIIGTEIVARPKPDGYTLILSVEYQHTINQWVYKLQFDPIKDFAPVGVVGFTPLVFAVNSSVPATSLADFIALAKAQPGKVSYSSAGVGTYNHLSGVVLADLADVSLLHVPYRGAAAAVTDTVSGNVQSTISTIAAIKPFIGDGRLP